MRFWRHWCSLLLSLASSWLSAQSLPAATCADPASTMLWQVQGAELDKRNVTVHLLGSIHVGKPDFYPLPPVVDKAFRAADTLVFEVDPTSMATPSAAAMMMQRAALPPGQTLDKLLDAKTMASLTEVMGKLGMPVVMVNQMKPWMVTLLLTTFQVQALGYNPANGVESYLMAQKPPTAVVAELETLESQLSLMETLDQSVFLQYSLQDFE
ncbi:MAG: TraB/GumN family protein, partial [Pseudomonadota bacterium]